MKKLVFFLSLFWLFACRAPIVEDGDAFPTSPGATTPAVSAATTTFTPTPMAIEDTPELTAAPATSTPTTPATLAPTSTATEDVPDATTIPPTSTTAPPTAVAETEPIRIQFEPGATTATLTGHVAAGESIEYLARASAGQHAHIEIVSQNNVANFSFVGMSDGQPYKRLENENRFWDGTLPESQDYKIRVHSLEEADYTLLVTIDPLGANVLQPVWPIVDGTSGFLMGGSHNGQWLDAFAIMPSLQDGERSYLLYAGSTLDGQLAGSPPTTPLDGPCGGTPTVIFSEDSDPSGKIALVARWEAAPRQPQSLPLDTPIYEEAVVELLQSEGISEPEVHLASVERIDLEGDGVDEVLVMAARLSGLGSGLPSATAGDYSLVLLRKIINGEVTSIPLAVKVFTEDVELADPVQYNLLAMLDLNGNGNLEIVIEGWYFEGRFVTVYEITEQDAKVVLSVGCRL
jgi:hypothetical protein